MISCINVTRSIVGANCPATSPPASYATGMAVFVHAGNCAAN